MSKQQDTPGVNVVDHTLNPGVAFSGLIPELLSEAPAYKERSHPITPADLLQDAIKKGAEIKELDINFYPSPSATGFPRKLDNSDLIRGYKPLYTSVDHLRDVSHDVKNLVTNFYDALDDHGNEHLTSMENEDLKKVCMQRTKYPGYHLELPFADDIKTGDYPADFYKTLEEVIDRYIRAIPKEALKYSYADAVPLVIDRTESMVGFPTQVGGPAQSQEARYATLKSMPPLTTQSPEQYLDELSRLSSSIGAPDDLYYSVMLSTRSGPTNKYLKLWAGSQGSFSSTYDVKGIYQRVRHVYPAPYQVNFLLSKLYYQLKNTRMNILGMWHDIDSQQKYIKESQKQGKFAYTGDFSGMDNHFAPIILKTILELLRKRGYDPWATRFLELIIDNMGVYVPSFVGYGRTTVFKKLFGWFSGSQLTAEMNCILGVAVVGYCIKKQNPTFWTEWLRGNKIIMNLGDDIQFTDDYKYDDEKWAETANSVGHVMPISRDTVFLKKILPTGWGITKMTKPISRVIQQAFYNEDSYDDKLKYPSIMLLGLQSRLLTVNAHPLFSVIWPKLYPILEKLNYMSIMTPDQKQSFRKSADFQLTDSNKKEVIEYASSALAWSSTLMSRADVQPSAGEFLNMLISQGFDPNQVILENAALRRLNYKALMTKPKAADIDAVVRMKRW